MGTFKEKFKSASEELSLQIRDLLKLYGDQPIEEVTVSQVYQGMRGITGLVTETSLLDPNEGIRFRGFSIPELRQKLPKVPNGSEPLPEGLFYLMLLGKLPAQEDVEMITNEWGRRSHVPNHVFDVLDSLPLSTHPMTMFSIAIMAMQTESKFARAYGSGLIGKKEYWDFTFEDSMNLIARLPRVAAYIFRKKYRGGDNIQPDHSLDWAANFAHMLGYDDESFHELMRLYMTIHSDHEGGNVSAHAVHLVGSALSDAYLSFSAGMNGLAGPLHGLANQEVIKWIKSMQEELGGGLPTKGEIEAYVRKTLSEGKVVPGYGHAVLRKTDPRFTAQMEFARKHLPDDPLVNIVWMIYDTVPEILKESGKVKNPWPNVDAHSGAILVHYGLVEYEFYTVLFGVSRALGVLASLCWDRALGLSIERPKSVTTEWMEKFLQGKTEKVED